MVRSALLLLASLPLVACHASFVHGGYVVDGVELEEQHEETLEIAAWHAEGLILDVPMGDVRLERVDGPTRIVLVLHETTQGDASARYEAGRIVVETASGEPHGIGDVLVTTSEVLPALTIDEGMGDIEIVGVEIAGALRIDSGMGDVDLRNVTVGGAARIHLGMGDLELEQVRCGDLDASVGMGDIETRDLRAADTKLSSGMGDVQVRNSSFDAFDASTGMGSIDCRNTTWKSVDLDTGLGSVSTKP